MTLSSRTATTAPPAAAAAVAPPPASRDGRLLAVVLAGQFMALLDVFVVNVAAPTIRTDLGASGSRLQLVVAGYTITYAVLLITGARLGGRLGPGRLFLTGLGVFTAASLACGLAGGTDALIAARAVQGVGAALMVPQVLSLIQRTFAGQARARALTYFSAVVATGAAAGMIVGGALIEADVLGLGWRSVFLVNVPIGLVLLVVGARVLPLSRAGTDRARGLDPVGLVLLSGTVLLVTVPLVLGQERDWPAWCFACLAGGALLAAAFGVYETRLARSGGQPLISPRALRTPGVLPGAAGILLTMVVNGGLTFSLSLHAQGPEAGGGLAYPALRSGAMFVPMAVCYGLTSLYWRRLPARLHGVLAPVGFLLAAVALLVTGLLLRDGDGMGPAVIAALACTGLGMGLAYAPTLARTLGSVRPEDAPDASGITVLCTQLGMLLGIAMIGTLFLDRADADGSTAGALWPVVIALAVIAVAGAAAGTGRRVRTP
ncbi:MFS transporter [Streptomyces avicenniae]|uniref:MFS transporter n=1 Tax=Streptomyces avicenniae TaxID=500153 RepID=UPI000AC8E159|nr:MFS transporter [Streptomyces avicenniae]